MVIRSTDFSKDDYRDFPKMNEKEKRKFALKKVKELEKGSNPIKLELEENNDEM